MLNIDNTTYDELSKVKIADKRNAVISQCSKGGFTIAQQLEVIEGDKKTNVFLKGALHVETTEGLVNLRDAINVALAQINQSGKSENKNPNWDE